LLTRFATFGQAIVSIQNCYIIENGGTSGTPVYIGIGNPSTNAVATAGSTGWIISESEFNMLKWNISTATGTYVIPFGYSTAQYLPLTLNIATAGIGSGTINFSTYHTPALNSGAEPSDVNNLNPFILPGSPTNTDNSYNIADRFYIIDANSGYTTKPTPGNITFSYISGTGNTEVGAPNTLTESRFMAQRFNSGGSTWGDWFGEGCTDGIVGNIGTVQTGQVTPANFFRSWSLWDHTMSLPLKMSGTNIPACAANIGTATVTAYGGVLPYTYLWNNGQTNSTATGLSAGSYTVTTRDNHGCTSSISVTIFQSSPFLINASVVTNEGCYGNSIGVATSLASGGATPYTYLWNPTSQTTATATGLTARNYTVTATDKNGCTATASVTVTQPSQLEITIASQTNVECYGGTGSATANMATGGTSPYSDLLDFNGTNGSIPYGNLVYVSGKLYGMTEDGGANSLGNIFSIDTNGNNYSDLLDFNDTNGANPLGSLTLSGSVLYGMTWQGGANGYGTIFSINTNGTAYADLLDFDNANGAYPNGSLTLSGGVLYGMAQEGGAHNYGNIFSINTNGTGYTDLFDFSNANGANPLGNLTLSGGVLYGMTEAGGISGYGTIFSINTNGSGYNEMLNFNGTDGFFPRGSLALSGSVLYGMTQEGGANNKGTIFSINTDGSGYNDMLDFNGTDGSYPTGSLTLSGSVLYGMTEVGGANNYGTIFSINTNGTGYSDLFSFARTNGASPYGSLILSGNKLYGMTTEIEAIGDGNVFSYNSATTPYTYNWSPSGGTNLTASNLSPATYTLTATDNNGCTASVSVTITQPASPLGITIASQTNVSCYGGHTGVAIANAAAGGASPYTYQWSNRQIGLTANGLSAGTYTITATDNHGCTATASATITQPSVMRDSLVDITYITCHGGDGSATIGVKGGTTPYTYIWSGGASTNSAATATNLTAGTYTVTIKDLHDCAYTAIVITMTQPGALRDSSVVVDDIGVSCNGGNNGSAKIGVKYGTTPYTYAWSPNVSTGATAINLTAGVYSVSITDNHGCTSSTSVSITQPAAIRDSISAKTEVTCNGGTTGTATLGVKGGTVPYTYLWTPTNKTTAVATDLSAGSYTVSLTDKHGCGNTMGVILTQPAAIRDSLVNITEPICHGGRGDATVGVKGGTTPYTYTWTPNVSTTATATNLSIGTYTVTIKDKYDCAHTAVTFTISQPEAMRDSMVSQTNIACNGDHNGSYTIGVKYGATPYTYSWFPNVSTIHTATGLSAGTYVLTVYDNNSCSSLVTNVIITQPAAIRDSISVITQVTCNGGTCSATIGVKDGTSPYTYGWSSGVTSTTKTATGLSAKTYTVTITDKHGCGNTMGVIITQPGAIRDSVASITYPFCHGYKGSATIGLKGGTSPYTYTWSGGVTSHSATATTLAAGAYTVTVKDKNACANTAVVFTITQPAAIRDSNILADQVNISCNGNHNGSATVGVKYGVSPFTYLWEPTFQNTVTATGLSAGIYTVTVSDYNGCSTTTPIETVDITQPAALSVIVKSKSCSGAHGIGTVGAAGGTSPYTYSWSPGGYTTATASNLADGTYTVTATDKHGCDATVTITFTCTTAPPRDGDNQTGEDNSSSYQLTNVSLYPNPNTGEFTIAGIEKGMLIEIYDYTGRKISTIMASDITMQFNLSSQANGIYLIRILSQDGAVVSQKKVVKTN